MSSSPRDDYFLLNHTLPPYHVTLSLGLHSNRSAGEEDGEKLLKEINDRKATLLLPVIVTIMLLMGLGLVGNPLSIYIYGWRWQASSTKVFLFSLAVIDLVNCLITIPTEVITMMFFYTFPSNGLCKVSRFTTYVMNNATVVIFLSIAIDRYLRICHPYKRAVSSRSAKVACGVGLLLGLAVSWPALFLYGNVPVPTGDRRTSVTGTMCLVQEGLQDYSLAFFVYLCSAFFVCALMLTVLYTLIGRVILQRKRRARRKQETLAATLEGLGGPPRNGSHLALNGTLRVPSPLLVRAPPATPVPEPPAPVTKEEEGDEGEEGRGVVGEAGGGEGQGEGEGEDKSPPRERGQGVPDEEERLQGCNVQNFSFHCKKLRPPRGTLMLFLITVVFITSFLPFLIISIIRHHRGPAFYLGLNAKEQVVVNLFIRSYVVNNCTNPIVYGLSNSQFRRECLRLYYKWCRRSPRGSNVGTCNSHQNSAVLNRSRILFGTPRLERKVSPEY